jgi:mRNA-degrading endonuclease RelE of RelBE toxin-antitoxin system
MTNKVEISNQAAEKLKEISERAKKTIDELIVWLADNYPDAITSNDETTLENDVTWTDEELDELLKPKKALTGKEIVEKHLATGVIGRWSDMGITDSVEWLEEQRAKRRNKYQW